MQDQQDLKCPTCGYNLAALTTSRCPECGATFVITDQRGHTAAPPPSKLRRLASLLWLVGVAAIVLSWTNTVTPTVGWIGFGVALVGTLLSTFAGRTKR
jgi:peptidoglycan/LPS O-acetylase OafA/YrhL